MPPIIELRQLLDTEMHRALRVGRLRFGHPRCFAQLQIVERNAGAVSEPVQNEVENWQQHENGKWEQRRRHFAYGGACAAS